MQSQIISFIFIRFLAVLCLLPLSACGETYSAEAIEAWVVDAETGQPIEGVVVAANWQLGTRQHHGKQYGRTNHGDGSRDRRQRPLLLSAMGTEVDANAYSHTWLPEHPSSRK